MEINKSFFDIRTRLLMTSAHDIGLSSSPSGSVPYGVMMETVSAEGIQSLCAFSSGETVLNFSNGGGITGGPTHDLVSFAVKEFLEEGASLVTKFLPTRDCPCPGAGEVRFFMITTDGILTAQEPETILISKQTLLWPLYVAGQSLMQALRLLDQERQSHRF